MKTKSSYKTWRTIGVSVSVPDPSGSKPVRQNQRTTWAYLEIKLDTMFLFIRPSKPEKKTPKASKYS